MSPGPVRRALGARAHASIERVVRAVLGAELPALRREIVSEAVAAAHASSDARPGPLPVGGLEGVVDVATDVGALYAHAHDGVITPPLQELGRMPDADLQALAGLVGPGEVVVDVGANIGYSSIALARAVGPRGAVIAFEPHPDNVRLLQANLARNGIVNTTVVAAAAWREEASVALGESDTNTGDHRVGNPPSERSSFTVRATRIDGHVPPSADVHLVFLDTQATEHHALQGAVATLERCRPIVLTEFWPAGIREAGEDPADVLASYQGLGYAVERILEEPGAVVDDGTAIIDRVDRRAGPGAGFATLVLRPL